MNRVFFKVLYLNGGLLVFNCVLWCVIGQIFEKNISLFLRSALYGGLVFLVPFLIYTFYTFRFKNETLTPGNVLYSVIYGLILKYFFTIVLFVLVFKYFEVSGIVFIFSYLIAIFGQMFFNYFI